MMFPDLSGRARGVLGWIGAALAVLVVLALFWSLAQCSADERVDTGVALGAAEANVDGYRRGMAASESASRNQTAEADAFRNEQDIAEETIDEAARTRTSPLDALFNSLQ